MTPSESTVRHGFCHLMDIIPVTSPYSLHTLLIFTWILSSWEVTSLSGYVWYTGQWKACESDTCGGPGHMQRLVICTETYRNATVHPTRCSNQPQPISRQPCHRICDFHRYQYKWQASAWSPCQPDYGGRRCVDSHYGIQQRNISCVARCSGSAPSEVFCSTFHPKPASSRTCSIKCPKDCITSDFSSWTQCNSCFRRYKGRYKTVLRAPADGGQECGELSDYGSCRLPPECDDNRATNFQYKIGAWTDCKPADGRLGRKLRHFKGMLGHQTRKVECINVQGQLEDERVCSMNNKRPSDQQLCVIPRDCLVSHWTTWSNWTASSTGQPRPLATSSHDPYRTRDQQLLTRNRNLIQVPRGQGGVCPVLIDRKEPEVKETEKAEPCDRYMWLEGEWGSCQPQVPTDQCGTGVQNRTVICVKVIDKVPMADYQCATATPVHTRLCEKRCPAECQVSSWNSWGHCRPDICRQHQGKPSVGFRTRRRYVLNLEGSQLDEDCPHLEESQQCHFPACFQWVMDKESSVCELRYKDMSCGQGILKTKYKCVDMRGKEVPPEQCPRILQPESCYVPCGGDCVLSDWSDWSPCPQECDPHGTVHHQTRTRDILAHPSNDGIQCPPDKQRQEIARCPRHSCETYHWAATPWSKCRLQAHSKRRHDPPMDGRVTCGPGNQNRDVYCYLQDGRNVAHKKCQESLRPEVSRDCLVPCPVPCQVSQFSDWSPCSATCLSEGGPGPVQIRRRFVLSSGHTQPCPFLEESKECKHLPNCDTYLWQTSDWSNCMTVQKNGPGYRARDVVCMKQDGDTLSEKIKKDGEKLQEEMCIVLLGSKPESVEECEVEATDEKCVFSSWTSWTGCDNRCNGVRKRWRSMEGDSNKINLCHDILKYPVQQTQHCNQCSQYREMPLGRWSGCILTAERPASSPGQQQFLSSLSMLRSNTHTCGIGNRYQALVCNDGQGHNISAAACYSKDFVEEVCFTPCPVDCVLSQWGQWSQCTTNNRCGNGKRKRYRYVQEQALDRGRSCHLDGNEEYDYQPCHIACETYFWRSGDWSTCSVQVRLGTGQLCGTGLMFRTTKCMKQSDRPGGDPVEVSMSHCDPLSKPHTDSNCSVPCTNHCVLSQWAEWTQCSPTCQGHMSRYRSIARHPSAGLHAECDHLQEVHLCSHGTNCFEYSLAWSDWGECILPVGRDCGIGYRVSYSECVRSGSSPVHRHYCLEAGEDASSVSKMMKETCTVPCPVDCVVSEWTEWSNCDTDCGLGYQTRFRHVVIPPQHNGRECPPQLSQERPCPFRECFHWRVSDWGECQIPASSCGYGTETRPLHCYRQDGLQVDRSLCHQGETTHFQLTRVCQVSCPGDCWVSAWSQWGACDRPCVQGITDGVQTRSRAIISPTPPLSTIHSPSRCPYHLVETRPCVGGHCYTYHWQTSHWYADMRNVWCERSDQITVFGERCPYHLVEMRPCVGGHYYTYHWQTSHWYEDMRNVSCERSDQMTVFGGCDPSQKPSALRRCFPACSVPHSYCVDVNRCICVARFKATYDETGALVACTAQDKAMHNNSSERVESKHVLPADGSTNFWMYAVIAAGSAFIIFVVVAIYFILKHSRRDQLNEMSLRSHGSISQRKHHTTKSSHDGLSDKSPSPSKLKTFISRTENEYT